MILLPTPEVVVGGLTLPECPRWQDGGLFFSDIAAGRIYRLGADGIAALIHEEPDDFVGGLGFLDSGDLLAVLSKQRRIVRIGADGAVPHADLTELCDFVLNDMTIRADRAYVSQPGFDIWANDAHGMPPATDIILVQPDGTAAVAASEMMSPNGMAISADGTTLYVAECTAMCITSFAIDAATGALSNRRLFATLPDGGIPDGICLDDAGGVWSAVPVAATATSFGAGPGVIRMIAGGAVTHLAPVGDGRRALACAIGGEHGDHLYICTVPDFEGAAAFAEGSGRLERVRLTDNVGDGG